MSCDDLVASLAAGLQNAAVLHVRLHDAGLLQETCATDGQARREKRAGLLAHARAFDGKVVSNGGMS